jgi:hypothetical protein
MIFTDTNITLIVGTGSTGYVPLRTVRSTVGGPASLISAPLKKVDDPLITGS